MKIALATDAWEPQISGVVTTLNQTVRQLEALGHKVFGIHPGLFFNFPCPTYPQIRLAAYPRLQVGRLLRRLAPDCVHIVTEGPIGLACRQFCRRNRLRFTTSFTTRFDEYVGMRLRVPSRIIFNMMRWFHAASSRVMVATQPLKEELAQKGFSNTVIWPRGVDTHLFCMREKSFLPYPRPIFLYVGRVAVEKNIAVFLGLELPGTKVVVGDGPQLPELRAAYPDVRFTGARQGEALARTFGAADAFVFPSRTDTFGIVMLEAMASGLPVAGYPVRGPVDIVRHGETGYLDHDLRRAAMEALNLDPAACRRFAERFSWQRSAEVFVQNLVPAGLSTAAETGQAA